MKSKLFKILEKYRYPIALSFIIVLTMTIIELKHPYYFLQDDNRDYYLPVYVANLRAFIHGEIPLFNFHQYCGTPLLSSTQSAPFYPLNYVALIISKVILGTFFGAIDIVAFFHLVIAGISFFYFMRSFGLHERSCFWGALAWAFCGFVVSVGDSWIPAVGYGAYLPLTSLLAIRLLRHLTVRNLLLLALARSLLFLLGWQQYFVYSVTFEIAHIILLFVFAGGLFPGRYALLPKKEIRHLSPRIAKFCGYYLLQYVCSFFIVLPVLLPGLHHIGLSNRQGSLIWEEYSSLSYNIHDWISGLINPFSSLIHDYNWTNQNFISHIGYLAIIFLLAGILSFKNKKYNIVLVYVLLGAAALLFASNSFITRLFYLVPIYNRFRWPFKVAFFTSFSLVVAATFGFDIVYQKLQAVKQKGNQISTAIFVCIVAIQVCNSIAVYMYSSQKMFGIHLDSVPFDEPLKDSLRDRRIVTLGPRSFSNYAKFPGLYSYTAPYLGFNYATFWELYHFGGYEPLLLQRNAQACLYLNYESNLTIGNNVPVEMQMKLLRYLRIWGVKWYIVEKRLSYPFFSNLVLRYSDNKRNVFYDSLARPFVFWQNGERDNDKVTFEFHTNDMEIHTFNASDGFLRVNVLFNRFFRAYIDGNEAHLAEAKYSQMELFVPGGSHTIRIEYSDPYFTYGVFGTGAFLILALLLAFVRRKSFLRSRSK
jgi:hypothetical protein